MAINYNTEQILYRVKGNLETVGATLQDNTGTDIDVTSSTILFRMVRLSDGEVMIDNASASVDSGSDGEVSYTPSAGDFDTPGKYAAYFIIDDTIDKRFPYDGAKFIIHVLEETESIQ